MRTKLLISGLALLMLTTLADAQGPGGRRGAHNGNGRGVGMYVDANNDGICDNFQSNAGNRFGNGRGMGMGPAYVDTNNDGICDNIQNRTGNRPAGAAYGNGRSGRGLGMALPPEQRPGQGQGRGRFFIDANNNGICDTYEKAIKK